MFDTPPLYVPITRSPASGVNVLKVELLSCCHCPPEYRAPNTW